MFTGKYEFVIELVVQTTNPNIAIEAICEEKLISVVSEIENLKKHFSSFVKIQLVYNTETGQWEFNYSNRKRRGYRHRKRNKYCLGGKSLHCNIIGNE